MAYGASLESWLGASPHGFELLMHRHEIPYDNWLSAGLNSVITRRCATFCATKYKNSGF